jgi:uncharacterized protein YcfJ
MDTRKVIGAVLGTIAVIGAYTPAQAEIVCRDVEVTRGSPPKDQHRLLGTAAGAALGGLVGNQFGGGTANTAITAAGVVAGGYAGNKVQQRVQEGNQYTTVERQCEEIP